MLTLRGMKTAQRVLEHFTDHTPGQGEMLFTSQNFRASVCMWLAGEVRDTEDKQAADAV